MSAPALTVPVRHHRLVERWRRLLRGLVSGFALLFFASCDEGNMVMAPDAGHAAVLDPCGGRCTEVELCVPDKESNFACARICANQLRCWSGCCLPLGDTGYNVCRPTNYCYAE